MDSRRKESRKTSIEQPLFVRRTEPEDLKATELFRNVKDEVINQLLQTDNSRICTLEPNQRLYTTRNEIGYLYVIQKGYVSIWIPSCFAPEKLVFLAWRGPQQILGELREVGATPSDTEIRTCDVCVFIELRLEPFLDLAASNCFLYRNIVNLILKKISYEGHRSEVVQMTRASRQVAQTLIHLAQDRCENFSFDESTVAIPGAIQQDELGAYAGLQRRSVNIELNKLKKQAIISYDVGKTGCQITILKLKGLLEIIRISPVESGKEKIVAPPEAKS